VPNGASVTHRSISYRQTPTGHQPTFGASSYPGVPSATVAIAGSRQSMFIQSCNTTVSREKGLPRDAHAMQMELSEGAAAAAAQFIR